MQYSCETHLPSRSSADNPPLKPTTTRSLHSHSSCSSSSKKLDRLAAENAVVIFTLRSCCMCHVVCKLLCSLGVNPAIHEVDDDEELQKALLSLQLQPGGGHHLHSCPSSSFSPKENSSSVSSCSTSNFSSFHVPAVFVGGKLLGGLDKVMAAHINGSLVPLLKDAGALWL